MASRKETYGGIAVALQGISHTFKARPVFKPVSAQLPVGCECLIRGTNGSGKSTLGKILSGELTPAIGSVGWSSGGHALDAEELCVLSQRVSPASSLHPHLTIAELIAFQGQFRPWTSESAAADLLDKAGLSHHMHQSYRDLSSGMQQRVKLTLALAAHAGLIVLDEPCANLDSSGIAWYREALAERRGTTTLVVCSNDREEDYIDPDLILELKI
jgi:ABC-type multidrug transport system ATPase subunit